MLLKYFFGRLNLSPFLGIPPNNQYIFGLDFKTPKDEEKLVDLESFIIVKNFFLKIICWRYLSPLNFLIVLINELLLSLSFFVIAKTNDKFSLFTSFKK